jgi:hypothetical protein
MRNSSFCHEREVSGGGNERPGVAEQVGTEIDE